MKKVSVSIIVILFLETILAILTNVSLAEAKPTITYTTHVQNIGWQEYVQDGICWKEFCYS